MKRILSLPKLHDFVLWSFVAACSGFVAVPLKAEEPSPYVDVVKKVEILDGKITCYYFDPWSKPAKYNFCEGFTLPVNMAVGEKYFANGKERTIGVVKVHRAIEKGGLWEKDKMVPAGCSAEEFAVKDFEAYTLLMAERCF